MIHLHLMGPGFRATGNLISTIQMLISLCVLETGAPQCTSVSTTCCVMFWLVQQGRGTPCRQPAQAASGLGMGARWRSQWNEETWKEELEFSLEK